MAKDFIFGRPRAEYEAAIAEVRAHREARETVPEQCPNCGYRPGLTRSDEPKIPDHPLPPRER